MSQLLGRLLALAAVVNCVYGAPTFNRDDLKNLNKAAKFLLDFDYIDIPKPSEVGSASDPNSPLFKEAISRLQRFGNINVTGKLDSETVKLINTDRCGVKDPRGASVGEFKLQGTSWDKTEITYKIVNYTRDGIPPGRQRQIFRDAMKKWQDASGLTITEVPEWSPADIPISFVTRTHGDPFPFDGDGGTLAHAFYPHNNEGLSGDAHFDDAERFTTETDDGINLDWVAVHEFGHSLGLEHSNVGESIMFPWYKGYVENIKLNDDDIKGIQALYPSKPTTTTAAPTTTKATTTEATTTEATTTKATTTEATTTEATTTEATTTEATTTEATTTEATTTEATTTEATTTEATTTKATTTEATTTETTTTEATTTEATTTEVPTTKATTTETTTTAETPTPSLPVLPNICKMQKFDSFLQGADGRTYVFIGDYFWVISTGLRVEKGPIKITTMWNELETPINSAYKNRDGRIIFFKGRKYWKYNGYRLEEGPRDIEQFGLPSSLSDPDAAFVWGGNKKTYFFKGDKYWRYNDDNKAVDNGYPRPLSVWGLDGWSNMDSAMTWYRNGKTYFFRGANYWKLYDGTLDLVSGYPKDIVAAWMRSC